MRINRRNLLRTAGAIVAATSLHRPVLAQSNRTLLLIDPDLREQDLRVARNMLEAGARTIQADLVRQWRDGLDSQIVRARGALAYVRWDKALLLTGLAREAGMMARQRRLDRSLFEVRIDPAQEFMN